MEIHSISEKITLSSPLTHQSFDEKNCTKVNDLKDSK